MRSSSVTETEKETRFAYYLDLTSYKQEITQSIAKYFQFAPMPKPPFPVALLVLLISSAPNTADGAISVLCNGNHYTAGDPFAISLAYVFSDLAVSGSARPGQDYYNISPYPNAFAYGHSSCSGNLTAGDCSYCLRLGVGIVNISCPMAIGGRAALGDCGVRYEQYPFV
ncbi:hypothetical protein KFK09_011037 [Dendrobium nobile]|uniref:Gnk2-homologous domain-containing protein n=1 Tax=Dendrobium nobile TaxID=94219 RepID=A0A8T3BEV0_DENNO|nr:hypothetical protein KFK09_011037 [Dendrobium nobile]